MKIYKSIILAPLLMMAYSVQSSVAGSFGRTTLAELNRDAIKRCPENKIEDFVLESYMGKWYEIARYANSYETECASGGTAEYTKTSDSSFKVINTCKYLSIDENGKEVQLSRSIEGRAKVNISGQIKVSFFGPFFADYNVVYVDKNYTTAVVSNKKKDNLWILTRAEKISDEKMSEILKWLRKAGYSTASLILHSNNVSPR